MTLSSFSNKTVIVTGAASGLGKALSKILVASGSKVVMVDKNQESLALGVKELGDKAEGKIADVTDFEAIKKVVDETVEKYGTLDYFFNNAGIVIVGEVRDIDIKDWNEVLAIDLHGVVNGVAAAYPVMVQQGSGHIVNIASVAGLIPLVIEIPYVTSKTAVVALSHSLRMEAKRLGVKVSVVCPGSMDTPIWTNSKVIGTKFQTAKELFSLVSWLPKFLNVDKAAEIVLKGVLNNKATIFTDFSSRVFWWCYKISPTLYMRVNEALIMKKFRTVRK
jgi:short-subunit dehydrogenase